LVAGIIGQGDDDVEDADANAVTHRFEFLFR